MKRSDTDRIERQVLIRAPRSRVWRALTDPTEFGAWFGVKVEGTFVPGARVRGRITHKGYEHLTWDITIDRMEPERLFPGGGIRTRWSRVSITRRSRRPWWSSSSKKFRAARGSPSSNRGSMTCLLLVARRPTA